MEELKKFCDFVNLDIKTNLGNIKTKWLSLEPAIARLLHVSSIEAIFAPPPPQKKKCSTMLRKMFNYTVFLFEFIPWKVR
jgi:hypothetical protein